MRWTLELHVAARSEVAGLALWESKHQLLNKRRYVVVGFNRALPLLDTKDFFRDLYFQILFDGCLTRQPPALIRLSAGEVAFFRWQ